MTDYVEQKELDSAKASQAIASITSTVAVSASAIDRTFMLRLANKRPSLALVKLSTIAGDASETGKLTGSEAVSIRPSQPASDTEDRPAPRPAESGAG